VRPNTTNSSKPTPRLYKLTARSPPARLTQTARLHRSHARLQRSHGDVGRVNLPSQPQQRVRTCRLKRRAHDVRGRVCGGQKRPPLRLRRRGDAAGAVSDGQLGCDVRGGGGGGSVRVQSASRTEALRPMS
jgi:hypothetical protein